jgi:sarcosine oxidase subunit beta
VGGAAHPDVLILGAGIAGCALAYHLGEAGRKALVLDPRPLSGGASGRAAGIVTEQLWNDWDIAVTREAHAEARTLLGANEPQAYWRNGFLRWTTRPDLREPLSAAARRLRGVGVQVRSVEAREMNELVPSARLPDEAFGLLSESDGCVTPSTLVEAYARGARERGGLLEAGAAVDEVAPLGAGWSVRSGSRTWTAPDLVVAAGAWSKRLLVGLGHPLPLCPYRTQAALLRPSGAASGDFPSVHDLDTDVYVRPELAGRVLAGDGTESVEADPERFVEGGDDAFLAHLAESLEGRVPPWSEAEVVASWAGVCTATLDRRPLVGPIPTVPGLFVMTGFNGFGVMRAGGIARRLARRIAHPDDPSASIALREVRPDRFEGPVLPFPPGPGFTLEAGDDARF